MAVNCASGIDATVLPQAAAAFGVSEVAESLATGMSSALVEVEYISLPTS